MSALVYLLRDLLRDRRRVFTRTYSRGTPTSRDDSTDIPHVNYFARLVKIL